MFVEGALFKRFSLYLYVPSTTRTFIVSIYDQADIHLTTPEKMAELMTAWKELGFETVIVEIASPFDDETAERFATEIRQLVDG